MSVCMCIKKYIKLVFIFTVFVIPFSLSAIVKDPILNLNEDPRKFKSEIYVHDLILDQVFYGPEDVVSGEFSITSLGDKLNGDSILYRIQLVGNYNEESNLPTTIYDYGDLSTTTLNFLPDETQNFSFKYKLPIESPSKNLGIQIQLYKDNAEILGRTNTPFGFTGSINNYLEHIAQVQVDGEPFDLLDTPTVYEGEEIFFAASLKNGTNAVRLTPDIKIYNKLLSGEVIRKFEGASIFINRFDKREQRISLPTFNYVPGIYSALINYRDEAGNILAGPFEIRYIVSRIESNISRITTNTPSLIKGEAVTLNVQFNDTPIDIRLRNYEESRPLYLNDLQVNFKVKDVNNFDLLAEGGVEVSAGLDLAEFSFIPEVSRDSYLVEVDLIKDNKVIDSLIHTYKDSNYSAPAKGSLFSERLILIIASVVFGLVLIILFILRARFIKKGKKSREELKDKNNLSETEENIKEKEYKDLSLDSDVEKSIELGSKLNDLESIEESDFSKNKTINSFFILILFGISFTLINPNNNLLNAAVDFIKAEGHRTIYIPVEFSINNPLPKEISTYEASSTIPFQIDAWSGGAFASMRNVSLRVSVPTTTKDISNLDWSDWSSLRDYSSYSSQYTNRNIPFTKSPLVELPGQSGEYKIYFELNHNVSWTIGDTYKNTYLGSIDILVE